MAAAQWVYRFGGGTSEGDASMRNLLGGKGANLAEMANLGVPVPPGFTTTTEICTEFYRSGQRYPESQQVSWHPGPHPARDRPPTQPCLARETRT
jgi:pyruvate,orthophosphate dikinase